MNETTSTTTSRRQILERQAAFSNKARRDVEAARKEITAGLALGLGWRAPATHAENLAAAEGRLHVLAHAEQMIRYDVRDVGRSLREALQRLQKAAAREVRMRIGLASAVHCSCPITSVCETAFQLNEMKTWAELEDFARQYLAVTIDEADDLPTD